MIRVINKIKSKKYWEQEGREISRLITGNSSVKYGLFGNKCQKVNSQIPPDLQPCREATGLQPSEVSLKSTDLETPLWESPPLAQPPGTFFAAFRKLCQLCVLKTFRKTRGSWMTGTDAQDRALYDPCCAGGASSEGWRSWLGEEATVFWSRGHSLVEGSHATLPQGTKASSSLYLALDQLSPPKKR